MESETCYWLSNEKDKVNCYRDSEISTFKFNKKETEIVHLTPSMTSTYFVKSATKIGRINFYAVESDAGNLYTFALDEKKKEIRILTFKNIIIRYKVKKISK